MVKSNKTYETEEELSPLKRFFKHFNRYTIAFIVVLLIFFVAGVSTLGNATGTGKSYTAGKGEKIVFSLEESSKISQIYVNVGNIYNKVGEKSKISLEYGSTVDSFRPISSSYSISNIYYKTEDEKVLKNANYNWVGLISIDTSYSSVKYICLTPDTPMEINEVAVVYTEKATDTKAEKTTQYTLKYSTQGSQKSNTTSVNNDPKAMVDSQNSFTKDLSYKTVFTQDEEYVLTTISNILKGSNYIAGTEYNADSVYNALGILIQLCAVCLFGISPFALRILPLLAACGALIFAYVLLKKSLKQEKYALLFAIVYVLSGLGFSIGRIGMPIAFSLFFIMGSLYFAYSFFAKGISEEKPLRSALSIVWSGLFFAAAFAVSSMNIYAGILILTVLGGGIYRIFKLSKINQLKVKKEYEVLKNSEKSEENKKEETKKLAIEKNKIINTTSYHFRISLGYFLATFIAFSIVLTLVCIIPAYYTYSIAFGKGTGLNYLDVVFLSIKNGFSISNYTSYSLANTVTPWTWFLSLKGATLLDNSIVEKTVLQWNAQLNPVVAVLSLVGFLFATIYMVIGQIGVLRVDKKFFARFRRVYITLTVAIIISFIPYLFVKNATVVQAYIFDFFYMGYIPLLFWILEAHEKQSVLEKGKQGTKKFLKTDIAIIICCVIMLVFFVLSLPMLFGITLSVAAAQGMFGWQAAFSNGHYGIV